LISISQVLSLKRLRENGFGLTSRLDQMMDMNYFLGS